LPPFSHLLLPFIASAEKGLGQKRGSLKYIQPGSMMSSAAPQGRRFRLPKWGLPAVATLLTPVASDARAWTEPMHCRGFDKAGAVLAHSAAKQGEVHRLRAGAALANRAARRKKRGGERRPWP
jgi:hypothetical protein